MAEFSYALAPLSASHYDLLLARHAQNLGLVTLHWEQIFSSETQLLIRDLFSVYLHTETELAVLRRELVNFAHHDAFLTLDANGDG